MTDGASSGRINMSSKTLFIGLLLTVFTAQCAVLKDDVLKRNARSPCDSCDQGPPHPPPQFGFPPPPQFGFPPPPPPPIAFRTHQWSGLARSEDGRHQGVFSGAAAALGDDTQATGEAFSLASSGASGAGAGAAAGAGSNGGYGQQSGYSGGQKQFGEGSYRESQFGYESHGGKSFSSNSGGGASNGASSGRHNVERFEGNEQQQVPLGGSFGSGSSAQSGAYSGNGAQGGQSNGGFSNGGGSGTSGGAQGSAVNGQGSAGNGQGSAGNGQGSAGNGQGSAGNGQGSSYGGSTSSYGARGDLGSEQQHVPHTSSGFGSNSGAQSGVYSGSSSQGYGGESNSLQGQQGRNHVGGSHGSYGAGSSGQSSAYQAGSKGFERNDQQQVELSNQGSDAHLGDSGQAGGYVSDAGGNLGGSSHGNTQETLSGALNLASQGLQTANQAGTGCTTCGKSSYALSNAKSHSGNAVALSIGG